MAIVIREMDIEDYDVVMRLWRTADGVGLSQADERNSIEQFLARNRGLSFLAIEAQDVVGTVLCGHDGRRGYVHHLAVQESHRRRGIASELVQQCLISLKAAGIGKCHLFAFQDNLPAQQFWLNTGWIRRDDLSMWSHFTDDAALR
jgi:putative acetyltransferase